MKLPLVNIIVVTFNEYDFTRNCLSSILNSKYPKFKIYLVDNGSQIKKYEKFKEKCKDNPKIKFIRLEENLGFGEGCNAALKEIREGYIVFLNNDTQVDPNWLMPVVSYMEKNPDVGACQPKIKDIKRKDYFEYAGAAGGFMDIYGYPFSRGRIFYTVEKDYGQYDSIIDLVWSSGTAMFTKKEVIDKVGMFDGIFFMYGEESDLCWRINHAGLRICFIPGSVVYHHGGATMRKSGNYRKSFYSHRNGLILLLKNYSLKELFLYMPFRFFLDGIAFFYYLNNLSHVENSFAIIKAYISLIMLMPAIIQHRRDNQKLRKKFNSRTYPLYKKSIIIDYFIKKKITFSSLNYYD